MVNKNYFRGLKENFKITRFRFDQEFKYVNLEDFLKDFFNNPSVRTGLTPGISLSSSGVNDVKFTALDTKVVSMDFFDCLKKYGIVGDKDYIRKAMEELYNDIEIGDKLRYIENLLLGELCY